MAFSLGTGDSSYGGKLAEFRRFYENCRFFDFPRNMDPLAEKFEADERFTRDFCLLGYLFLINRSKEFRFL